MPVPHYDAVVIGAGPAGATAAFELAGAGARTLLLEKHKLPRHKTCGGGVTYKVARVAPCDISPAVERTISGFVFTYRMGSPRLVTSPEPLVYMVRRSQFDNLLTSQAIDAGAELQDATTVEHIEIQETGVMVAASSGSCTADFLIGADGALGITARAAGLMANRVLLPAVEHEVEVAPSVADFWQDKMSLDLGTLRASYGWVFPKGDHLNVGVGGFGQHSSFGSNLRRYDAEHLQRRIPDLLRVRKSFGYVLPLRKESSPIQRGRVLLVGDAAGLVEAMTGEGIYYAVRSGQIAAQSIISAQHGGYQARIDREIMPDLLIARSWAALYRWAPLLCYAGPVTSARAWRATGRVLRGDYQIRAIHRRLGLLGKLADRLPTYP